MNSEDREHAMRLGAIYTDNPAPEDSEERLIEGPLVGLANYLVRYEAALQASEERIAYLLSEITRLQNEVMERE